MKYRDDVCKYIYSLVSERSMAEDLMQDTFVKAYLKADTYNGRSSVRTWLYSIAHNATMDLFRKQKSFVEWKDKYIKNHTWFEGLWDIRISENKNGLYGSLNKLESSYKQVILLRKIQGYSIKETGELLNWSETKVKVTLYRALRFLQKQLIEDEYYVELY
ncbi:RNA polymerase sigma factor [Terribacillus aidingensis]|nr:RNA polymerase sigma factor [Terribacillus aidingensis]